MKYKYRKFVQINIKSSNILTDFHRMPWKLKSSKKSPSNITSTSITQIKGTFFFEQTYNGKTEYCFNPRF